MVKSQTGLVTIPATTERFENGWLRRRLPLHIAPLATQLNPCAARCILSLAELQMGLVQWYAWSKT